MFGWRKEKDRQREFTTLFRSLMPEPVLSIAGLGEDNPITTADVHLIFVLVEKEDLAQFSSLASLAIRLAVEKRLDLVGNVGGLLQFAVGPRRDGANPVHLQRSFVTDLSTAAGVSARIAFGCLRCHVGTVGVAERKSWGCYPVAMVDVLRRLLASDPGNVIDLGQENSRNASL